MIGTVLSIGMTLVIITHTGNRVQPQYPAIERVMPIVVDPVSQT